MKRVVAAILIVTILMPMFYFLNPSGYNSFALQPKETYEHNRVPFDSIKHLIPENQWKNSKGFQLNATLYVDKGIMVYGSYDLVPKNDFGNHIDNIPGYYIKDGVRAEYRYHGFDFQGNVYTNNDFRRDADSGRSGSEKNWIYRPYRLINGRKPLAVESDYNKWALGENEDTNIIIKTQQWINRMIDFTINSKHNTSKNPYDYIHVQSPSGMRTVGEGRMWHIDANGKRWYQTFSIPRQQHIDKVLLPTVAQITVLNKPEELIFKKNQDTLTLKVRVEGIYQDEGKNHTETQRTAYYTGYDIDHWEISLQATAVAKQTVKVNKETLSKGSAVFDVVVERNQVLSEPVIQLVGGVKAIFGNKESAGLVEKSQTVALEADGKSLMAYFTLSSHIALRNGNNFAQTQINYKDASIGKIVRYEYHLQHLYIGGSTSFAFNTSKVNDNDVNQKIYEFISPRIAGKTEGEHSFEVTQTVRTADGSTDTYKRTVLILIKPVELGPITTLAPKIEVNIPDKWFDIVPLPAVDLTEGASSRRVTVDGVTVNADQFFSNGFTFGASDSDRLLKIEIEYEIDDFKQVLSNIDPEFKITKWIYVYSTKPRGQFKVDGSYKQNRKMTVTDTSNTANADFVLQHYPIINYQWNIKSNGGDITSLRTRNISDVYKELMFKKFGEYTIELTVSNALGRVSDVYSVDVYIHEDYKPAVILNIWNNAIARNEEMQITHDVVSTDGDIISKNMIEIYHDDNNDGNATKLLATYNAADFTSFKATALGTYKVVNIVEESFGEDTLSQYITDDDKIRTVVEREFFVDNLRPLTEMYIDIPMNLPEIDVFFMMDENIHRDKNNYVVSNRININNDLRLKNIRPKVEVWDLHTYVYSQPASTVRYTGGSYPPAMITHTSGDYSGTLNRVSVTNNPYSVDAGWWTTVYDTVTTTQRNFTTTKDWPGPPWYIWDVFGEFNVWAMDYTVTTTTPRQVWVSNWLSYNDYTGHYNGTVYKYVKQPYVNPFRTLSDKYVIYISDGNISNMADLQSTLQRADAKIILVGQNSIRSQIPHEHFILNNKPINELINDVINYIGESNPYVSQYLVLAGEDNFNITFANYDDENDPLIQQGFQYVQDVNYYDNSIGKESYARDVYSEDEWIPFQATRFNTTGKFEIFRRIMDRPSTDPNFADFSYTSNIPRLDVYSHRRPIAHATLDWDYDVARAVYLTTWVDQSYDLDHVNRRADKGIIERRVRYRRNGGEWIYKIPDELVAGTYNLEYYVKDVENAWSNVFTLNFTLNVAPPMQMDAKARPLEHTKFSMTSIPASESLQLYDVWTRYPYNVRLDVAMFQGTTQRTTTQTINFSAATGSKVGNDINWNNITHVIPATLPDGSYNLRITAIGDGGQTAQMNFPVTVLTPINLVPDLPTAMVTTDTVPINAATSKYANTVSVQLYRGHAFTTTLGLTGTLSGDNRNWNRAYTVPTNIPDGNYVARYTATTPNGNTQTVDVSYRVDSLKITGILQPNPAMAGDWLIFTIKTEGNAERLEIFVDPDIMAKDQRVEMGYKAQTYPLSMNVNGAVNVKTDIMKYTLWVTTDLTLDKNSNRLRAPYKFIVRAWKGTNFKEVELELEVQGDIRSLLKPGIKNRN